MKYDFSSSSVAKLVVSLYIFTTACSAAAASVHKSLNGKNAIRCYSCMSLFYEPVFPRGINELFVKPENFTDQCRNPHLARGMMTVDCQSVCINMREEVDMLGVTVTGYIRGCFDRMLIKGFNQTIVRLNRWLQRDSCQYYNKQEVLQSSLHHHTSSKSNMIYICTCYSDGCNGSHGLNGAINITLILQKHLLTVGGLIAVWTWSIKVTR